MGVLLNIYFVLLTQASVIFAELPPIKKCKLEDSDCVKRSAQNALASFIKGIPEAGTETLDPMHVDTIKFDLSGLKLTIKDSEIKGLKSAVIEKISFDTAKKQLELKFKCDINLKGKYKAEGNLLILPISGDGDTSIRTKQLEVEMSMPYSIVKDSNGKDVIELQGYKYTFDTVGNTHYNLTNLFNGNKQLILPLEKCKLEDSHCMTEQFQKSIPLFMAGIPDVGVEVLDVMNMSGVKFDVSGLQFTLTEGQLQGLKSTVIENVKWDTKKKHFTIEYHMDGVVKGRYTAAGHLLILPITGDGQMTLKLKNVHIKFHINYEMVNGKDGKKYVHPTKYNFEFEVKGLAHYHLTNLFNGNKELSDAMLIFLNENWKQITAEFGKPVMEVVAKKIFMNIKSFLEKEPIEDIAEL